MQNLHRLVCIAQLALASGALAAQPLCTTEGHKSVAASSIECAFFSGTRSYRHTDYSGAGEHWRQALALKPSTPEEARYRLHSLNNLGYLYFTGMGVNESKSLAIHYWEQAYKAGHEEAAYHLCHVYADRSQATYNPDAARTYCTEALNRYGRITDDQAGKEQITPLIKAYLAALPPRS